MGKVAGYIFNDEVQALLDELIRIRNSLGPGEWFRKGDKQRYDELNRSLRKLIGRE